MKKLAPALICVVLSIAPVAAADSLVYESYEGVTIGRVFLSQPEREFLDARRHTRPDAVPAGRDSGKDAAPAASRRPAAGFIIGPDGRSKVWRQGDFVDSAESATRGISFPGKVKIVRHEADESGDED